MSVTIAMRVAMTLSGAEARGGDRHIGASERQPQLRPHEVGFRLPAQPIKAIDITLQAPDLLGCCIARHRESSSAKSAR